jgi:CheY-like chemotaxis protein
MESQTLRILLADDDEADRLLFKDAFQELKISTAVETVNDGVELMEYLAKKEVQRPQLLFLDINMPRKNGLECLKEIRANKALNDIAIAIFSTSESETDMRETFLNGANIYIHKPADFGTLKQMLEKAVMVAHQYQEPPFNKENFLLKI